MINIHSKIFIAGHKGMLGSSVFRILKKKIAQNLRPVVLIANSSWYLFHYRAYLIKKLNDNNIKTILIAPKDAFTDQLSSLGEN